MTGKTGDGRIEEGLRRDGPRKREQRYSVEGKRSALGEWRKQKACRGAKDKMSIQLPAKGLKRKKKDKVR